MCGKHEVGEHKDTDKYESMHFPIKCLLVTGEGGGASQEHQQLTHSTVRSLTNSHI